MGSCCNNRDTKEREIPEGIEPCCNIRGKRCICLPYDDGLVIASQIMAIISVLISWVWWVAFIISIVALTLVQLLWCCRQNVHSIYASSGVAAISSLVSLGLGIYILVQWKHKRYCYTFAIGSYGSVYDENYGYASDYCNEEAWGSVAIVCGILWFAVSVCMFYFAKSGRHAKWEKHHSKSADESNEARDDAVAVELGAVPEVAAVAATILESDRAGKVGTTE